MRRYLSILISFTLFPIISINLVATSEEIPTTSALKKTKDQSAPGMSLREFAKKHDLVVHTVKRKNDAKGLPLENVDPRNNLLAGHKILAMSRKNLTDIDGISEVTVIDNGERKKITDVKNLHLLFAGNQLVEIPTEIGKLNNVILLFLKDNRIKAVPKEVAKMKSLERIYLTKNEIAEVPDEIFDLRLTKFDFGNNRLTTISRRLCEKGRLAHLNLSGNLLTSLPDCMQDMQHLKVVDLSDNRLTELPKSLANVAIIHTLRLSGNKDLKTIPEGKGFSSMTANITVDGTSIDVKKLSKALQARINAKDLRQDDD